MLQSQKASSDAWIQKAEIELADAKRMTTCLSDGFAAVDEELKELRKGVSVPNALDEEVVLLRQQVQNAEDANMELIRRAQTIHSRHQSGDLV